MKYKKVSGEKFSPLVVYFVPQGTKILHSKGFSLRRGSANGGGEVENDTSRPVFINELMLSHHEMAIAMNCDGMS
ncbi:MAG: hypothetical protein J6I80_01690 [Clostridia bacterium]|nr:hypothetical protein [Clostridia bacterium]